MTKLTTHVLDVYSGKPGKGIKVDLFFLQLKMRLHHYLIMRKLQILMLQLRLKKYY